MDIRYGGDHADPTPREDDGTVRTAIVAIDATPVPRRNRGAVAAQPLGRVGGAPARAKLSYGEASRARCVSFSREGMFGSGADYSWGTSAPGAAGAPPIEAASSIFLRAMRS